MEYGNFSIHSTLHSKKVPTRLPLRRIKKDVLGKDYKLSLVFIGDKRSRTLNKVYRKKDKPTDVLAFALEKDSGELFINPYHAKRRAKAFGMTTGHYLGYLFIHGNLHLKGYRHGSKMEQAEQRFLQRFRLS